MIGGMLATSLGAGFLGGIVAGFLAGYITQWLKSVIKLPKSLQGLMPVLVLPLLSTAAVGLLMIYVIGTPVASLMNALTSWLTGMSEANAFGYGRSREFAVGLLGSQIYSPMAPPLALALATVLNKFTREEVEAGKVAWILGLPLRIL